VKNIVRLCLHFKFDFKFNLNFSLSFVLSFVLGSFFGCTRPAQEASLVSLSLPSKMGSQQWGSQAFDEIAHVSVNVSGDGIAQPIIFNWDGDEGKIATGTAPVAPTTFNIEVPQGSNRLIQLLVVYKDKTAAGSMQFFYGDTNRNLNLPTELVDIEVSPLGSSTEVVDGQVMGRYLNGEIAGEGFGPTGKVDILYTAPGKPSMIIDRDVIINGWFSFFMLSHVPFSYRLPDGSLLWDGPVELNSPIFAAKPSVLRVSMPMHQRNDSWSGPASWKPENPQVFVYGWFGNATNMAGKVICDTPTPSALTRISTGSSSATFLSRTNATPPTNLFNGALSSFYVEGGVPFGTSGTACLSAISISAAKFKSALNFSASLIDGKGKDNAAGFRGAFISTSEGNSLNISNSANGRILQGTFLPGVASQIDGYIVFKKQALEEPHTHFAPCGAIASGALGFVPAGNSNISGDAVTINVVLSPEEATAGALIAVCSTKGGQISDAGFWVGPSYFRNMGPPPPVAGSSTYLRFEFEGGGFYNSHPGSTVLTKDKCYQLTARIYQAGMPFPYSTVGGLNLTALSASFGSFYTSGSCVTGLTTANIPTGTSTTGPLYFKATSVTALSSISVTMSDPSVAYGTSQPIFVENGKLKLQIPQKIVQGVCYTVPMDYIEAPGDGMFFSKISSGSIASGFTMTPGPGGSFYTNGTCGTTTTVPSPVTAGSSMVFYKASDNSTKTIEVSASGATQADALPTTVTVGAGGPIIDKIMAIPMMSPFNPGQCNQIALRLYNYDGAVIPAPYPFSVSFSANVPGALFDDPGCSTPANSVNFVVGETTRMIGFIPSIANTTVSLALVSGAQSTSASFNVSNPAAGGMGVDPYFFYVEAPSLNGKKIVGSHEFPKSIPLRFTPGATNLQCSVDGITYAACSGTVVDGGFNYNWTETDAVANQARYFQVTMPGGTWTRTAKFKPTEIYGSDFEAIHCNSIQGASTSFITINSSFPSNNVICLAQNVILTKGAGEQIILNGTGGRALIGHTSGNLVDVNNVSSSGNPSLMINGDITGVLGAVIANLNFINLYPGDTFLALGSGLISLGASQIRITGNTFTFSGASLASTYGLKSFTFGDPDISLKITDNQFMISSPYNSSGTTFGISLVDANVGSTVLKNNFLSGAGGAYDCQITGIQVSAVATPISNIFIENLKWLGNGCAIKVTGTNSTNTITNLNIKNANIELNSMPPSSTSSLGIQVDNVSSFNLTNNRVAWTDATPLSIDTLVKIGLSGGGSATGTFSNNILSGVKETLYGWITVFSPVTLNSFDFNQFIYEGISALSYKPIYNTSNMLNISATLPHGNNLFCSSSSNIWSNLLQNANSGSFDAPLALSKCTKVNDVNPTSHLCQSICSP
jgi:hypothetical protein